MQTLLLLLTALLLKHFIADFVLQSGAMAIAKRKYLYLLHSFWHGIFTFVVFLLFGATLPISLLLALLDFTIHHHIDYIKSTLSKKLSPQDRLYWIYLGADQLLHGLTYLGLAAYFIAYT